MIEQVYEVVLDPSTHYIVMDPSKKVPARYSRLMLREAVRHMVKEAFEQRGVAQAYYEPRIQMSLEGWYLALVETTSKQGNRCFTTRYSGEPLYCGILTGDHALFPLSEMNEVARYDLHEAVFDASSKRFNGEDPIQYSDGDVNLLLFQLKKTDAV